MQGTCDIIQDHYKILIIRNHYGRILSSIDSRSTFFVSVAHFSRRLIQTNQVRLIVIMKDNIFCISMFTKFEIIIPGRKRNFDFVKTKSSLLKAEEGFDGPVRTSRSDKQRQAAGRFEKRGGT